MSADTEKLIGERVTKFRKERDLTQAQLSELVEVTTETISRIERGVGGFSLDTMENICDALHIQLKDLFDFEHPPKVKGSALEKEIEKVLSYLRTKKATDVKMSYQILREIFAQVEANYQSKI